jgi:hemolysin III
MLRARLRELSVEELANTITHGFGLALSIVGFIVLVAIAALYSDAILMLGCVVYGVSLVALYAASTLYHSAVKIEHKEWLRLADHCGIYLLIAGSYTPFSLVIAGDGPGWMLLAIIWGIAVAGIVSKIFLRERFLAVSVVSYVVMGWMGAFGLDSLMRTLGIVPIALLVAGGVAYSLGVIFFAWKHFRHHHAIFHVFVLIGSIMHYVAIAFYVVPRTAGQ